MTHSFIIFKRKNTVATLNNTQNNKFIIYLSALIILYPFHFRYFRKASSNLLYGGKIFGEAAVERLEDIGARVIHKYQIDNNGQWDLSDVKVNIKWPLQVTPGDERADKPGKWLLYLESVPRISGKLIRQLINSFIIYCLVQTTKNIVIQLFDFKF